jgi:hypothetical protein
MNKSPFARIAASLVVVAVLALLAQVGLAAFEGGKGNLSGTVQTADGKPAVGLNLKLVKDMPIDMRRPGGKGKSTGMGDSGATGLQNKGGPRTKVVAQATTDASGKFTMQNVEEGSYRLEAGNKNMGWIYQDVSIEPNKTVELNDLKLTKID